MMKHLPLLLLLVAIATVVPYARGKSNSVGCKDADGNDVDWWIALKAPEGSPYGYIDSNQHPPAWAYDPKLELAATSGNPLAETVQHIYGDNAAHYLIYSDQPFRFQPKPKQDPDFHAHAKGVIAFDGDQGFWLLHSNPNFPDNPADSKYTGIYDCNTAGTTCGPKSGQQRYGQSYLCMTLDATNLEKVAQLIQIEGVTVAGADLGGTENQFPELNKILEDYKSHRKGDVPQKLTENQPFTTIGREQLLQFAMTPTQQGDDVYMYEQLIEPKLKSGLWVETWKEGKDFVSYCPSVPSSLPGPPSVTTPFKYETRTINRIKINDDLEWTNPRTSNSGDHSKWAITHAPGGLQACSAAANATANVAVSRRMLAEENCAAASVKIVCMGDINRAGHQLQRGGGTVCFMKNTALWQAFLDIVAEVGACGEL